ncbi:unnamed protein product, partial [Ectocarpus sp. 8 AP-2014]
GYPEKRAPYRHNGSIPGPAHGAWGAALKNSLFSSLCHGQQQITPVVRPRDCHLPFSPSLSLASGEGSCRGRLASVQPGVGCVRERACGVWWCSSQYVLRVCENKTASSDDLPNC